MGDMAAPPAGVEDKFHYICFVEGKNYHLQELNGGIKGLIERGSLYPQEDALGERALRLGVRNFCG